MSRNRSPEDYMARSHKIAEVTRSLRNAIRTGSLKPGEIFPESELARRYQASSETIRKVIQRLEKEGLAKKMPDQNAFIVESSKRESGAVDQSTQLSSETVKPNNDTYSIGLKAHEFYARFIDTLSLTSGTDTTDVDVLEGLGKYIQTLTDLQHIIDNMQGKPHEPVVIGSIDIRQSVNKTQPDPESIAT